MAALSGLKQIADYVKRSEKTTLKMITDENLPAVKIGGAWESDTQLIDRWRQWKVMQGLGGEGVPLRLKEELLEVANGTD